MGIAHDFYRNESLGFSSSEAMINFIVDNYIELMSVYRVMKKTNMQIEMDQKTAKAGLDEIRELKDSTDPKDVPDFKKKIISAKEKHFQEVLKQDSRVHMYNGQPLEQNHLTLLILNHPILMAVLEKFDTIGRVVLAGYTKKAVRLLVTPLINSARVIHDDTSMPGMATFTSKVMRIADDLPELFEETIINSLNPDLDYHHDGWDVDDDDDNSDGGWIVIEV